MPRTASAIITVATGRHGVQQLPVQRVEQYTTTQSIDVDADSFSLDIGDPDGALELCLNRDNEVRASIFVTDLLGRPQQIFQGIADVAQLDTDFVLSTEGRDEPSSLAVDSDALPGRWRHVIPKKWISERAAALGISRIRCADMATITSYFTDGSEKEWASWYRMARMRGMYMWSDQFGTLIIDKLGYALSPTYRFGKPPPGQSSAGWIPVEDAPQTSTKQSRVRQVLVYGMTGGKKKKGNKNPTGIVAQGLDTTIAGWKKKPRSIMTSTTAKNQVALQKIADDEVFESIVGAQELILTIRDEGVLIAQNMMALVNMPEYGIENEPWFVVGVQRQGGPGGLTQIVRLREKGFALSKRIPSAPTITKDPSETRAASSIAAALANTGGIRWSDSFVRATNEFGVANGWDFAVFLGVLLAMCEQETGFTNEREGGKGYEWAPLDQWSNLPAQLGITNAQDLLIEYERHFANSASNVFNPMGREAGVGPMQLTSIGFKEQADKYGWNGAPATSDEYQGGRWNPDSNIRAAAQALIEKLKVNPPADPTNANDIWIGVARYNGSTAYADKVKALFNSQFYGAAKSAVAAAQSIPAGSAIYTYTIPGHGVVNLSAGTPSEAAKAIAFCMARLGDPYEWGGVGPNYDCSSLVTAALAAAAPYLARSLDRPITSPKHHGDDTYTLYDKGTAVTKDNLLPGDLVFFRGLPPEHVGMYIDDGLFVHDPQPGETVKVSSLGEEWFRQNWTGARRYVNWPYRPA
jgi:cell wall-associated NlpC family hydrolase/prophage tail gpP-like protein